MSATCVAEATLAGHLSASDKVPVPVHVQADHDCAVPPTGLGAETNAGNDGMVLTWTGPSECTPEDYAVYRRDTDVEGSRMRKIAAVAASNVTRTDQSANAGETCRYRIRSDNKGPRSEWVEIDVPAANHPAAFDSGHSATLSVDENTATGASIGSRYTATGASIGSRYTATDADTDTLTCGLSGTGASSFSIDTGKYLIATASRTDGEGSGKSANASPQVAAGRQVLTEARQATLADSRLRALTTTVLVSNTGPVCTVPPTGRRGEA